MSQETIYTLAGYGKFFILLFVFIVFYSYAYSIYRRQKTGEKDFEKYSNLVLDDSLDSAPLEKRDRKIEKND
ncbi:MAG TPA: cytochrome c oxidase, cbb3-type, CcoQ subunit [Campylobacterales bacterium]|jgi:cytochrome c oxidase cbb3-type subunit 4|nr:cytochrome c oxidase, cbb3-type, CcoQ subunit [Campylobacterales bacterium]HHD80658.1 cytochrome c oxidase, cbb3-type, CcoQ subunit [Campylobacterales bacterium]